MSDDDRSISEKHLHVRSVDSSLVDNDALTAADAVALFIESMIEYEDGDRGGIQQAETHQTAHPYLEVCSYLYSPEDNNWKERTGQIGKYRISWL